MQKSKYLIIVFRTKTEVFSLIQALEKKGISAATTGTPKEAGIGCGIAVKTDALNLNAVKRIVLSGGYDGFFGIYAVATDGVRTSKTRVM